MTEKPERPIRYHFPGAQILKVTTLIVALFLINLSAAIIMLLRVMPFEINRITGSLLVMTWLPTIMVLWGAKVWWFDFARFLNGTRQFREMKPMIFFFLILMLPLLASDTVTFWRTEDVRLIVQHVMFICMLFGSQVAFTILIVYSEYRHKYPQRTVDFLTYCNMEENYN